MLALGAGKMSIKKPGILICFCNAETRQRSHQIPSWWLGSGLHLKDGKVDPLLKPVKSQSTVSFWAQFSIEKKYLRLDIWPKRDIDEIKGHEKHMAMVNNLYEGGRTLQRWKECSFLSALGNIGLFFFGERVAQNTKMYITRSLSLTSLFWWAGWNRFTIRNLAKKGDNFYCRTLLPDIGFRQPSSIFFPFASESWTLTSHAERFHVLWFQKVSFYHRRFDELKQDLMKLNPHQRNWSATNYRTGPN